MALMASAAASPSSRKSHSAAQHSACTSALLLRARSVAKSAAESCALDCCMAQAAEGFARARRLCAESKPVREAQASAHVTAAALALLRARKQRRGLLASARERRARVFSTACVCELTLHASDAAAQSPRLR
jgi:hypothetical protein